MRVIENHLGVKTWQLQDKLKKIPMSKKSTAPEDPESYRFGAGLDYYLSEAHSIGFSGNWFMSKIR